MKKILFASAVISILLLGIQHRAAAENSTGDQQPAPQYSKLPPLQLSGSTLTQKEYLQAALWLAQQNTNRLPSFSGQAAAQANTSAKESGTPSDLDITKLDAKTFWPSVGVFVAAIFTFLGTIYTNRITLKKTKIELEHQESVISRAQCKEYCIEFISNLDIKSIEKKSYDPLRTRYLVAAIAIFSPQNYSKFIFKITNFLHSNLILFGKKDLLQEDSDLKSQFESKRNEYICMYTFIILHTNAMFSGVDLDKNIAKSKVLYIKRGVSPEFFD